MLRMQESAASNQVLLRVRFAEVSRSAITDLGASLFTGANGYKDVLARSTTVDAPRRCSTTPIRRRAKLVFSDFLNLFLFDAKHQLGAVIKALQTKGQFQSLAEPNLVAESGKEASFLAGGEFPVPIAQGSGANLAITVHYKEFGIRLNFTPVITRRSRAPQGPSRGQHARLRQRRRAQGLPDSRAQHAPHRDRARLLDGQTFAIAGLINNSMNSTLQKIPGIGDIPILGLLFKSKAAKKDQTELVVMITPQILAEEFVGRDDAAAAHARAVPAAAAGRRRRSSRCRRPSRRIAPSAVNPTAADAAPAAPPVAAAAPAAAAPAATPAMATLSPAAAAAILNPPHPAVVVVRRRPERPGER